MHPAAPGWLQGTHPRGGQISGSLNILATPPALYGKVPTASALCLAICLGITLLIPSSRRKTPCSASTGTIWEKIQRAQASALQGKSLFLAQQTYTRFGLIQTHLNLSPPKEAPSPPHRGQGSKGYFLAQLLHTTESRSCKPTPRPGSGSSPVLGPSTQGPTHGTSPRRPPGLVPGNSAPGFLHPRHLRGACGQGAEGGCHRDTDGPRWQHAAQRPPREELEKGLMPPGLRGQIPTCNRPR